MDANARESLLSNLLTIVNEYPRESLDPLRQALASGKKIDAFNASDVVGISGPKLDQLLRLLANQDATDETKLLMLETAMRTAQSERENSNSLELVYTGPPRLDIGARNTRSVMEEMLNGAKEVTVVAYQLRKGAESIVEKLSSLLAEGTEVTLVIDDDKKKKNRIQIDNMFKQKGLNMPDVYTRTAKSGNYFKIHSKILIVDQRDMLVTSANLTGHAMEINFEVGIRVRGALAKDGWNMVHKLIDEKFFERMTHDDR